MKTLKLNFTVPEDVAEELKSRIDKRKRSAFVVEAVRDRLDQLRREQLRQTLREGYLARKHEDSEINNEWEKATLESWK